MNTDLAGNKPEPPSPEAFDLAPGFRASATACGLKRGGGLDLAMVAAQGPCSAAGVYTTNRIQAAPVLYDRERLRQRSSDIRAVIANSGCANACTGLRGMADAQKMAALTAQRLGCEAEQVLVLSTGVIGVYLDMAKVERGVATLFSPDAHTAAIDTARAIMTTDTRPKIASQHFLIGDRPVAIRGFAKGAGMIHPHLATMLAVVTTDALVAPELLRHALAHAGEASFNRVSVDGDMSPNDTVLMLASGAARAAVTEAHRDGFTAALTDVCTSLARQIARDGEGATRLVEIRVTGAPHDETAHTVANQIACSLLVKTAIHGGDPNWGRILAAAGASGVAVVPERMTLDLGPRDSRVRVVEAGLALPFDRSRAAATLERDPVEIELDLGIGSGQAVVWTCDLSAEYVAINADYTT